MVEKLTFNYLATALVDNVAVSMQIAHSLQTWDICGIVLCDKTAHFRVAFYCPQHKVQLCNDMLMRLAWGCKKQNIPEDIDTSDIGRTLKFLLI